MYEVRCVIAYSQNSLQVRRYEYWVMELILQKLDVVDVKHDFMINEKFQMSVYELNQLVNDF